MHDPTSTAKAVPGCRDGRPHVENPGLADAGTRAKPLRAMLLAMVFSSVLVWGLIVLLRSLF